MCQAVHPLLLVYLMHLLFGNLLTCGSISVIVFLDGFHEDVVSKVFTEFWTAPIFRKAQISYVQDVCLSGEHFLRNFGLHQFCINHKFLMCLSVPMCDVVY